MTMWWWQNEIINWKKYIPFLQSVRVATAAQRISKIYKPIRNYSEKSLCNNDVLGCLATSATKTSAIQPHYLWQFSLKICPSRLVLSTSTSSVLDCVDPYEQVASASIVIAFPIIPQRSAFYLDLCFPAAPVLFLTASTRTNRSRQLRSFSFTSCKLIASG